MSASVSLLNPIGSLEVVAARNVLLILNKGGTIDDDEYLGIYFHASGSTESFPYNIPFDGVITKCTIRWEFNNTPFDIRVYINGAMEQVISSTQVAEILTFNVPVLANDLLAVEVSENPVTGSNNRNVWCGFILESS